MYLERGGLTGPGRDLRGGRLLNVGLVLLGLLTSTEVRNPKIIKFKFKRKSKDTQQFYTLVGSVAFRRCPLLFADFEHGNPEKVVTKIRFLSRIRFLRKTYKIYVFVSRLITSIWWSKMYSDERQNRFKIIENVSRASQIFLSITIYFCETMKVLLWNVIVINMNRFESKIPQLSIKSNRIPLRKPSLRRHFFLQELMYLKRQHHS